MKLISHNEPIFVSGLGEAPFHKFFEQYRGHSISDTLVVGTPYGAASEGSGLVYLDGVTKATASVRIAHESIMAAALEVARTLYERVICDTVPVADCRTAEATKLMENIFRSVNIALVNELALLSERMEIDIWEVIEAAKTKPFFPVVGCQLFPLPGAQLIRLD